MNDREDRLKEVASIAVALEKQTGCPARLMIGQWALESEWGAKPVGHANYFGIKKAERHEKCCTVTTHEVVNGSPLSRTSNSPDYDSLADSCRDYCWLITNGPPYQAAWQQYQQSHNLRRSDCLNCPRLRDRSGLCAPGYGNRRAGECDPSHHRCRNSTFGASGPRSFNPWYLCAA